MTTPTNAHIAHHRRNIAMDFESILTGLAATSAVTAIIGAGAIKAAPGFARWATNKVATFFR
ncbi:hypothetical protein [Stenotrophomonas maltophilia]|uniref:hypothetical protein n=1 Tax=Stenotrophomonas maltophilia TaxID=40324 RepID=UPI001E57BD1F